MKIIFLIRSLEIGGAERQLVFLANGLKERGHEINILVFYKGGALEELCHQLQIPIIYLNKKGRFDNIYFLYRLIKIIRQYNPDILHSYLTVANIISALIKLFLPRLKVIWGIRSSNMDLIQYDKITRLSHWVEAKLSHIPKHIVLNSHAGLNYIQLKKYVVRNASVIPNGIDTNRFRPDAFLRKNQREKWGIESEQILIGLVARLDPMKDHINFLSASEHILEKYPNVRLVCVGNGPEQYVNELKSHPVSRKFAKHILWVPGFETIESVYNALDMLCSSSAYGEGFSNVIGEAMACGCPAVVTDVGDSAMIVGNFGKVVAPKNSAELSNAVEELLVNKLHANQIRKQITENYSLDKLINKTEKILFEINHA